MSTSLMLNHTLRYEGSSFLGMLGIMSGAILNIALDPLFIYGLGMGTAGAGLATIISQFVSFCVLIAGSSRGENIKINLKDFSPTPAVYREILRGGFPALCRQSLSSVSTICINRVAGGYGDAALAGFSIVQRVTQVMTSVLMGFGQGFQPVCGFNYGAKKFDRVLKAFWFSFRFSFAGLIIFSTAAFIFAPNVIAFFRNDPPVIIVGTRYLRIFCVTLPSVSWVIINNMMHQTLGKAKSASILALSRQGLFLLPFVFILPRFFGLQGLQFCQPFSNIATAILALPLGIFTLKELHHADAVEKMSITENISQ
jgi:putative MATE family efflux protein